MPCYTVQESQIQFLAESTDPAILKSALESLGYSVTVSQDEKRLSFSNPASGITGTYDGGRLESRGTIDRCEVQRAYSEKVIETVARKQGWKASEWTVNPKTGNRQIKMTRRSW